MSDLIFVTDSKLFERDALGLISRKVFARRISDDALSEIKQGARLWVIVKRGESFYIQSRLEPDLIQRYLDGRMSGWYLVSFSLSEGGHISSPENLHLSIPDEVKYSLNGDLNSIALIDSSIGNQLQRLYVQALRQTNLKLTKDFRRKNLFNYVEQNSSELREFSIHQLSIELRSRFYEDELSLSSSLPNINDPFLTNAAEVFSFINNSTQFLSEEVLAELEDRDSEAQGISYRADCVLRPLTSDDLVSREMIWNPKNYCEDKYKAGLLKTNLAEHRHQEILRDLLESLADIGVTPLGSSSIDLAIELDQEISLVEIKSATPANFKDQALKACGQLAEYAVEFSTKTKKKIRKILVIEVPQKIQIDVEYVDAICRSMNTRTAHFRFDQPWPKRCALADLIFGKGSGLS